MDVTLFLVGILLVSFLGIVFFGAPYVPTLKNDVADALAIRPLTKKDTFVDLGCGDGVLLRAASPKVSQAIGYELSPWMYLVSKILCRKYSNIAIEYANIWKVVLPRNVTVIYVFFNGRYMNRIAEKVQYHANEVGHDIDVVSFGFSFSDMKPLSQKNALHLYRFTPLYKHK